MTQATARAALRDDGSKKTVEQTAGPVYLMGSVMKAIANFIMVAVLLNVLGHVSAFAGEPIKEKTKAATEKTKAAAKEFAADTKELAKKGAEKSRALAGAVAEEARALGKKTAEVSKDVAKKTKEVAVETHDKVKAAFKDATR